LCELEICDIAEALLGKGIDDTESAWSADGADFIVCAGRARIMAFFEYIL
jgi:hypothetical protein